MSRRFVGLLLLALAIPATAQTIGLSIGPSEPAPCLALGNATYRLAAAGARADYTVRIDSLSPDIRIQLADTPDAADLVLVDDGEQSPGCGSGAAIKSVKIDAEAAAPDLTIGFAAGSAPADYRIYVRSQGLEPMAAAALFAASRTAAHRFGGRMASHSK